MNEHSPGPWHIEVLYFDALADVVDANEKRVAKVYYDEGRLNLRLILNAPELLALVRELVDWPCLYGYPYETCRECPYPQSCPLVAARALLEKIDGKEKVTMAKRKKEFVWKQSGTSMELWCDQKHENAIRAVNGVVDVSPSHRYPGRRYFIDFSPLYDKKAVMAAIEAIITGGANAQV